MLLVLVFLVIRGLLVQKILPFRLRCMSKTFGEFLQMNGVVGPNTQVPHLELGQIKLVIKVGQEAVNLVSSQLGQSLVGIGLDVLGSDKVGFDRGAQEFAQIGLLQTFVLPGGDAELGRSGCCPSLGHRRAGLVGGATRGVRTGRGRRWWSWFEDK